MMVLFLGGPWHNERHEVTPGRGALARSLPTHFKVPVAADQADEQIDPVMGAARSRQHVTYKRRFARGRGERLPVYVSPEYQGPARA